MTDEIEMRLLSYRSFETFWNIFDGLCIQIFYSPTRSKRWLEVICVVKSKVIQVQPKYRIRDF